MLFQCCVKKKLNKTKRGLNVAQENVGGTFDPKKVLKVCAVQHMTFILEYEFINGYMGKVLGHDVVLDRNGFIAFALIEQKLKWWNEIIEFF